MTNFFRYSLLTGLLFFIQTNSWATEVVEKIHIDADHMQLNIETGFSVYTGNVKIAQGELKLTGDRVTLQQSNKEVERITVTGKPAHYNHVTENGENIQAESEYMVYTANQNKLVMTVNAKLKQPGHQVSSQKIVYDTEKKIVIAGDKSGSPSPLDDGSNANQRVNITLTPKKEPVTEKK
ncbi:MAG: lipopolysaccharide transport periplasmic protein LptA [Proteobacteria bacterium]|nr:lipopolysaccharide transport periplasmic protein LptA [Pseudomonadota bacterium]